MYLLYYEIDYFLSILETIVINLINPYILTLLDNFKLNISNKLRVYLYGVTIKIEFFTFCDFAQENGGKLTIVGTFDTIISRNFPCIHPQLSVVIRLRFDIWEFGKHSFRIETSNLEGDMSIESINGNIEVIGVGNATAVSHLVFSITNLHFKEPGLVNFVLYIDDKEIGSIPLYIRKN